MTTEMSSIFSRHTSVRYGYRSWRFTRNTALYCFTFYCMTLFLRWNRFVLAFKLTDCQQYFYFTMSSCLCSPSLPTCTLCTLSSFEFRSCIRRSLHFQWTGGGRQRRHLASFYRRINGDGTGTSRAGAARQDRLRVKQRAVQQTAQWRIERRSAHAHIPLKSSEKNY